MNISLSNVSKIEDGKLMNQFNLTIEDFFDIERYSSKHETNPTQVKIRCKNAIWIAKLNGRTFLFRQGLRC